MPRPPKKPLPPPDPDVITSKAARALRRCALPPADRLAIDIAVCEEQLADARDAGDLSSSHKYQSTILRLQADLARVQALAAIPPGASRIDRLRVAIGLASADASWTAVRDMEHDLKMAELEAEAARNAMASASPEDMSAEEWRQRVEADARAARLPDLDVYVEEWLGRTGYRFGRDADGRLTVEQVKR